MLQLGESFDVDELQKIKKRPLELVLFTKYRCEGLKKRAEFDKSIIELSDDDVSCKGQDYHDETQWEV